MTAHYRHLRVLVLVSVLLLCAGAARGDPLGLLPGYDDPQPSFSWQGQWQSHAVYFRSLHSGASLYGTLFAPAHPQPGVRYPLVLITPGSSVGVQAQYQWSARDLAGHGYIAFTIDPRGAGKSGEDAEHACGPGPPAPSCATTRNDAKGDDYLDALESGIAFALSPASPYHALIDPNEIGAAGHSAGADTLSYQQGVEPRLKAIVAWDNLISSTTGDQGNANCNNKPTVLDKPRVPALGEASETCSGLVGPDAKKTGYELWRKHGIPSMEVVFAGSQHTDWAQEDNVPGAAATGTEQQLHDFEYYTRAWFDLYLRHIQGATATLLASSINGRPRDRVISSRDHSAVYLPQFGIDCENLRLCTAFPKLIPATIKAARSRLLVTRGGWTTLSISCHGNPGARCDAELQLVARIAGRTHTIGSRSLRITAGHSKVLRLHLQTTARHSLDRHRKLKATLLILAGTTPDFEHARRQAITLVLIHKH